MYLLLQDTVLWDTTLCFCSRIFGIPLPEELPRFRLASASGGRLQCPPASQPEASGPQQKPNVELKRTCEENILSLIHGNTRLYFWAMLFDRSKSSLIITFFTKKRSWDQKNWSISPGPHGILIFLSSSCLFHWKHPWFTVFRTFDPLRCCLRPSKKMAFILIGPTLSMCHKGLIDVKLMSMLRTMLR